MQKDTICWVCKSEWARNFKTIHCLVEELQWDVCHLKHTENKIGPYSCSAHFLQTPRRTSIHDWEIAFLFFVFCFFYKGTFSHLFSFRPASCVRLWLVVTTLPPELFCKVGQKIGAFCILGVILSCCSTKVSQRDPLRKSQAGYLSHEWGSGGTDWQRVLTAELFYCWMALNF